MKKVFTARQEETIRDNLNAFKANCHDFRIEKDDYGKGFYVFVPAKSDSWVQYCYNIDYLNGWLYGAVQGMNKVIKQDKGGPKC